MTLDILKALVVILENCLNQDNCKECPMRQFCGKMPAEWQPGSSTGPVIGSFFRTGEVIGILN